MQGIIISNQLIEIDGDIIVSSGWGTKISEVTSMGNIDSLTLYRVTFDDNTCTYFIYRSVLNE